MTSASEVAKTRFDAVKAMMREMVSWSAILIMRFVARKRCACREFLGERQHHRRETLQSAAAQCFPSACMLWLAWMYYQGLSGLRGLNGLFPEGLLASRRILDTKEVTLNEFQRQARVAYCASAA